jgi:hypothetical protein
LSFQIERDEMAAPEARVVREWRTSGDGPTFSLVSGAR